MPINATNMATAAMARARRTQEEVDTDVVKTTRAVYTNEPLTGGGMLGQNLYIGVDKPAMERTLGLGPLKETTTNLTQQVADLEVMVANLKNKVDALEAK